MSIHVQPLFRLTKMNTPHESRMSDTTPCRYRRPTDLFDILA